MNKFPLYTQLNNSAFYIKSELYNTKKNLTFIF